MRPLLQIFLLFMVITSSAYVKATDSPSTAFYYAANPPLELLTAYERVIVESENITSEQLRYLQQHGVTVYAYLSIGEVNPDRAWFDQIKDAWKKGTNTDWNSTVMDMNAPGWHNFLLNQRLRQLWQQGYRGVFLDTMDSYQLLAKNDTERQIQQQGMIKLLKAMKEQYSDVHLLFNRGFEILASTAGLADGLVAESLFAGWNAEKSEYKEVPAADQEWLLGKLKQVQADYDLPVTVIDYLPPEQREEAEKVAERISEAGFIPWVSTPALDSMGAGRLKLIPRKVLLLYDSHEQPLQDSEVHKLLAMPLEYLGYIPDYWDIQKGLPEYLLKGRYAGIVSWLSNPNVDRDAALASWIYKQVKQKLPVAMMGVYPFTNHQVLTRYLGLSIKKHAMTAPVKIHVLSNNIGYESTPGQWSTGLPLIQSESAQHWLKITDSKSEQIDPVFISSWGGIALNPYITQTIPALGQDEEYHRWIINPFEFLKAALQLPSIPVPDATTENGNRILTLHIDGDGFYNKTQLGGGHYSSELIRDEFIKPLSLPHTVSIIEGEIGPEGLKPELSPQLQEIARSIFKLPNVEIASHSFSHPFNWSLAAETATENLKAPQSETPAVKTKKELYHLPIPGYSFNAEREIKGSIAYIDKTLAPAGKKTKVFLWSGDSLPNESALAWAEKAQVANLNGGDTIIRKGINSITYVAPSGIVRGRFFQPYAPIQNENYYTHSWTGPFYGYQRVIETFQLTEKPMRLKPIGIYYHFYSGDRQASVRALHRVYDWAMQQETLPMWISEYAPRLSAFRSAVYEQLDNGWRIHAAENIRTLRLAEQTRHPDLRYSDGVAGYRKIPQGLYIALNGDEKITLQLTNHLNNLPYLTTANARVQFWRKNNAFIDFRLTGHQPVKLSLAGLNRFCSLKNEAGHLIKGIRQKDGATLFTFKENDTGTLRVACGQ